MATNTRTEELRLVINGEQVGNSVTDLRKKQRDLNKELNKTEVGSKEWIKTTQDLNKVNKRIDDVKKKQKEVGNEWKKQGQEFKRGIMQRIDGIGMFGVTVGDLRSQFVGVTRGMSGATKASKLFKLALMGTGIGAIVVALGALVTYLTSTQAGMDKVTSVTRPLVAVFQKLLGIVQELGGSVFKGLARVIDGDIVEGFKTMGQGVVDAVTNIDDAIEEGIKAGTKLDKLQKQIERTEVALAQQRGKLNTQYQRGRELAQDQSLDEEIRRKGAMEAIEAQNKLLELEQSFLDLKIEKMKEEHALNDTSIADQLELARLIEQRDNFEAQAARKRASAKTLLNTIDKQIAAEGIQRDKEEQARIKAKQEAEIKADKEKQQQLITNLTEATEQERLIIAQKRADGLLSEQEYNNKLEELELAHLLAMKEMREQMGLETMALEKQIADFHISQLERQEEADQEKAEADKERQKAKQEENAALVTSFAESTAAAIENAETIQDATKGFLNSVKQSISAYIAKTVADAITKSFTSTPNPLIGLALAPIAAAGAKAIFNKIVPSFYHGGDTGDQSIGMGDQHGAFTGYTHANEFVIPEYMRNDPYVANVERYIENKQRTGSGGATNVNVNPNVSASVNVNDAATMKEAAIAMLAAADKMSRGVPAYFNNREYQRATDEFTTKETTRSRAKLN
jgi:tetrahydromethanopterin S-methyltransferase subunit G